MKLIVPFVLLLMSSQTLGFIPNKFLAWTVNGISLRPFTSTITHKDMSRAAILRVAADVLRDNPNPRSEGSSSRIAALSTLTEKNLITAYYGERQRSQTRSFKSAIDKINNANANVDLGTEQKIAAAHFDSEQLESGQNRLIQLRQAIVTQIEASNFDQAQEETGRMFHTLQDFYSHSNWIENNNLNPYSVLGRAGKRIDNIAAPDLETCMDCTEGTTIIVATLLNLIPCVHTSSVQYNCRNNINNNLIQNGILTSGYHLNQRNQDGQVIAKPRGKCSHGGFLDATADMPARGGINKDSPSELWSPHHYLYEDAASVAQQATADILQEIRRDVNNDRLFSLYLGLTVPQTISVAYVIDTTGSMSDELPEIQATIPTIRTNLEQYVSNFSGIVRVRYILVPFNDPDPGDIIITEDINEFLYGIGNLTADGGGDEPEPSIGAIIRAVKASEASGPVFVFTDATASDGHRLNEATSLITAKNVRVTFALVRVISRKRSVKSEQQQQRSRIRRQNVDDDLNYRQIAGISGGQIFNLQTADIPQLASLVIFSAVQSRRTIFRRSGSYFGTVQYTFPVDSSTIEVILSVNGQFITGTTVTTSGGIDVGTLPQFSSSLVSTSSYIAQVTIDGALRGQWTISIQSQGSYNIQVYGNSDLSFSNELFRIDSCSSYGFSRIVGKPFRGEPIVAMVTANQDDTAVTINTINLINDNGVMLQSVSNLTRLQEDTSAAVFESPPEEFRLQIMGEDSNGFPISHISDTSVQVASIDLKFGENTPEFATLPPGKSTNVTLVLVNGGESAQFMLTVNTAVSGSNATDFFKYDLTPRTVIVGRNSSTEILIGITLAENTTEGSAIKFTVIAESSSENDFLVFSVITEAEIVPVLIIPTATTTCSSVTFYASFSLTAICIWLILQVFLPF